MFIFDTPQCSSPGRRRLSGRGRRTRRLVPALEFAQALERFSRASRTARGAHAALVLPETGDCRQSYRRFVHNECHRESRLLLMTFSVEPCRYRAIYPRLRELCSAFGRTLANYASSTGTGQGGVGRLATPCQSDSASVRHTSSRIWSTSTASMGVTTRASCPVTPNRAGCSSRLPAWPRALAAKAACATPNRCRLAQRLQRSSPP